MAGPEKAEKPPGQRPPDSDPFYMVFAQKVTILSRQFAPTTKSPGVAGEVCCESDTRRSGIGIRKSMARDAFRKRRRSAPQLQQSDVEISLKRVSGEFPLLQSTRVLLLIIFPFG
jgi:hypothetical protein